MAYDAGRVSFTPEEHEAARLLDGVVEQFSDGFQVEDLASVIGAVPLIEFIAAGGNPILAGQRLVTLAVMLERDNGWVGMMSGKFGDDDGPVAEST